MAARRGEGPRRSAAVLAAGLLLGTGAWALGFGPVAAQAPNQAIVVQVDVDYSAAPPTMRVDYQYDTGAWTQDHFWLIPPGGQLLAAADEHGALAPRVNSAGVAFVTASYAPGTGYHRLNFDLALAPPEVLDGGFVRAALPVQADPHATLSFGITPPPGAAWVASTFPPGGLAQLRGTGEVGLLFGPPGAAPQRTAPPDAVGGRILTLQDLEVRGPGDAVLRTTSWYTLGTWSPRFLLGAYPGWTIAGAEDAWGPLAVRGAAGAPEVLVRDLPGAVAEVRVTYALGRGDAHPLARVHTPLADPTAAYRHFLRLTIAPGQEHAAFLSNPSIADGKVYGPVQAPLDVAVDQGLPAWRKRVVAPFHLFARDEATLDQLQGPAQVAAPALLASLGDAGLPARAGLATVVLPASDPVFSAWEAAHWSGWGMEVKDSHLRDELAAGRPHGVAATLVHEGFHAAQFDVGEGFWRASFWVEGTADDAVFARLPANAVCSLSDATAYPNCYWRKVTAEELDQYYATGWAPATLAWQARDPVAPGNGTLWGYGIAAFLVSAYRAQGGDEAYRAVWREVGSRPDCCAASELVDLMVKHAAGLTRADVERPWAALRTSDPAAFQARTATYVAGFPPPAQLVEPPSPAVAPAPAQQAPGPVVPGASPGGASAGGAAAANGTAARPTIDVWDPAYWEQVRRDIEARAAAERARQAREAQLAPAVLPPPAPPPPPPEPWPEEPVDEPGPDALMALGAAVAAVLLLRRRRG